MSPFMATVITPGLTVLKAGAAAARLSNALPARPAATAATAARVRNFRRPYRSGAQPNTFPIFAPSPDELWPGAAEYDLGIASPFDETNRRLITVCGVTTITMIER
jgi:hypothetical protein